MIGDADAVEPVDQRGDALARRLHGGHAAGLGLLRGLGHRAAADCRQVQEVERFDRAGCHQRAVLAVTVAAGGDRRQAEALREAQIPQRQRADRRLRVAGVGDRGALLRLGFGVKGCGRPDALAEAFRQRIAQAGVGEFDGTAQFVDMQGGFAAHVDVLGALSGEQEADRRALGRCFAVQSDVLRQRLGVALQMRQHAADVLLQRVEIGADDGQRDR